MLHSGRFSVDFWAEAPYTTRLNCDENRSDLRVKTDIHPKYETVKIKCACGNEFETRSTLKGPISVEICSECHPFYTGKQKLVDTAGRVDRFRRKYAKVDADKKKAAAEKAAKAEVATTEKEEKSKPEIVSEAKSKPEEESRPAPKSQLRKKDATSETESETEEKTEK